MAAFTICISSSLAVATAGLQGLSFFFLLALVFFTDKVAAPPSTAHFLIIFTYAQEILHTDLVPCRSGMFNDSNASSPNLSLKRTREAFNISTGFFSVVANAVIVSTVKVSLEKE